jgi:hypothetical protein
VYEVMALARPPPAYPKLYNDIQAALFIAPFVFLNISKKKAAKSNIRVYN